MFLTNNNTYKSNKKLSNLVLNKKSPRPISKSTQDAILNNYDIAVKSQVPHQVLDADASTTKPIVIIPDLEHLHHRSNQNNPHRVIDAPNRKEYKQWLLEIKGYNHYKLHINDFWNWGKMRDPNNLDESYLNFCKYLIDSLNIISGLIGGLPITQVIVRSSANINVGGKSKISTILSLYLKNL